MCNPYSKRRTQVRLALLLSVLIGIITSCNNISTSDRKKESDAHSQEWLNQSFKPKDSTEYTIFIINLPVGEKFISVSHQHGLGGFWYVTEKVDTLDQPRILYMRNYTSNIIYKLIEH
jgi:hypothetical protein